MSDTDTLIAEINKALGPGTLRRGSDPSLVVEYLPTGVLPIDVLLQGGIPRGRWTEFFGDYSTLKSYIALRAIAEVQAGQSSGVEGSPGKAALIDTEHSFDPDWASSLGVDTERLIYQTPETGEEAVDTTEILIRGGVDIVVWDSVAGLLPQAEQTKRLSKENVQPARLAALMSLATRRLTAANSKTALLLINQTRNSVGVTFGNPETVPGGRALPFYASYRLALRNAGKVREEGIAYDSDGKKIKTKDVVAHKIKATLEKSKLSAPWHDVFFTLDLRTGGIDELGFLIGYGLEKGFINHEGTSWTIGKNKVRGYPAFRGWMETHPTTVAKLRGQVLACPGGLPAGHARH